MRLIDADALKRFEITMPRGDGYSDFVFAGHIHQAPTIDAVPVKHGEWVGVMTEEWCPFDECKCSVCGDVEYFNKGWKKFSYCPTCGAKMD